VDRLKENVESLRNLNDNLREYRLDLATVPYVVQYNKRDLPDVAPLDYLGTPSTAARAACRRSRRWR